MSKITLTKESKSKTFIKKLKRTLLRVLFNIHGNEEKMLNVFKWNEITSEKLETYQQLGRVLSYSRNMPISVYANSSGGVHTGFIIQLHSSLDECIKYFKDPSNFTYNEEINKIWDCDKEEVIEDVIEKMSDLFETIQSKIHRRNFTLFKIN